MSENKFTPGPWSGGAREIVAANGTTIAGLSGYKPQHESEANARLIAAAPELYTALKKWVNSGEECGCDTASCKGTCLAAESLEAIAKAEGKSCA